jgi:hypothetical protein
VISDDRADWPALGDIGASVDCAACRSTARVH